MNSFDREDLKAERYLAQLEGRTFTFSAFRAKYQPIEETSTADVEHTLAVAGLPSHKQKRQASIAFQTAGAANRDELLLVKIKQWVAAGASMRRIAAELTKLRAPKFGPRGLGKPWTQVGVLHLLRRHGFKTAHGVGWGALKRGEMAPNWTHWTQKPEAKAKLAQMSAEAHAAKRARATTA